MKRLSANSACGELSPEQVRDSILYLTEGYDLSTISPRRLDKYPVAIQVKLGPHTVYVAKHATSGKWTNLLIAGFCFAIINAFREKLGLPPLKDELPCNTT